MYIPYILIIISLLCCDTHNAFAKEACDALVQNIPQKKSRTIKIKNGITPEMTRYRFWGSYYKPTTFYVTIGNKRIKPEEEIECNIDESNRIDITYHYEFKNGMVTGSKCIELEVPANETSVLLTFSWDKAHRFISSCGRTVCAKRSVLNSPCNIT